MQAELLSIRQGYESKINSMKTALSQLKEKEKPASSFMLAMQSFAPNNNQGEMI